MFIVNLVDWWRAYGGRSIDLQRFAKRIVSLCASSSGCERNWSTFEFVSEVLKFHISISKINNVFLLTLLAFMVACRFIQRRETG
jgi:hypothetical protein